MPLTAIARGAVIIKLPNGRAEEEAVTPQEPRVAMDVWRRHLDLTSESDP
jgi:hypothetical protein